MGYYEKIKKVITERLGSSVIINESNGALEVAIPVRSKNVIIKIQGLDVPELDLKFEDIKRYHSAGSVDDMIEYVDLVLDDIQKLRNHKEDIEFKQKNLAGIFRTNWKVSHPAGLAVLG